MKGSQYKFVLKYRRALMIPRWPFRESVTHSAADFNELLLLT